MSPTAPAKPRLATPALRLCASGAARNNPLALLSWQPRSASMVWTRREWTALCEHLHNDNPSYHFIMGFRGDDRGKRYVRSKRLTVQRAIDWAWASIAGSPKSRLAFSPYASNERQESRWGGLDFDAHNGGADRARELALFPSCGTASRRSWASPAKARPRFGTSWRGWELSRERRSTCPTNSRPGSSGCRVSRARV